MSTPALSHSRPAGGKDPKAGCAIMLIIGFIVIALITAAITVPFLQSGKMSEFTQDAPQDIATREPLATIPPALQEKLAAQYQQLSAEGTLPAQLHLTYTVAELNTAIRAYEEFQELQGTFAVASITPDEMRCQIAFQLNANPFSSSKERPYLNGVLIGKPEVKKDEIILAITTVEPVMGTIPEGFLNNFTEYRIMQPYTDHPVLGRIMYGCEEILLGDGALTVVVNTANYADPAGITPKEDNTSQRQQQRYLMPFLSFIVILGLFFFIRHRRNAQEAQRWQELADQEK